MILLLLTFSSLFLSSLLGCTTSPSASSAPTNIVLISVDGLRLDRTGFGGGPHPATPNMDAFVKESAWFPLGFSQANESLLSHASLFTGRYPSEIAVMDYLRFVMDDGETTLPEMLQAAGYRTAAFQSGGHIGAEFGFQQGFDHFMQTMDFGSFQQVVPKALAWFSTMDQADQADQATVSDAPFFVFLHGYDCHRPYFHGGLFRHPFDADYTGNVDQLLWNRNLTERIFDGVFYQNFTTRRIRHRNGTQMSDPTRYQELARAAERGVASLGGQTWQLSEADISHLRAHYDSGVLVADTYLGLFLEGLRQQGLWDQTLVIIVSDHGEDLQTHGYTNHRPVLFDSTTQVPMVLGGGALPSSWRGTRRAELADAVDLVPTLADVADITPPAGAQGRSLWALLAGDAVAPKPLVFQQGVLGQLSVRSTTHRLVYEGSDPTDPAYAVNFADASLDGGAFTLFQSEADPLEQTDVLTQQVELAETLRLALVRWYSGLLPSSDQKPLTEAQRKNLQDHGYW